MNTLNEKVLFKWLQGRPYLWTVTGIMLVIIAIPVYVVWVLYKDFFWLKIMIWEAFLLAMMRVKRRK